MKYLESSFSVNMGASDAYRENYEQVFGKKEKPPREEKQESWTLCPKCGRGHFCQAEQGK
jgi:hypothetical protein